MSKDSTDTSSHLIGGLLAGLATVVVLQPFDLLKTRVQQNQHATLTETVKGLNSIFELWRGTVPSGFRTSLGSAMYVTTLDFTRKTIAAGSHNSQNKSSILPKLSMHQNLLAGSFSRALVGFITMPITIIKVRYESTVYQYSSLMGAVKSIYKTEGLNGFFRGFYATALRDAPYAGIYVLLYEKAKETLPRILPSAILEVDHSNILKTYSSAIINVTGAVFAACTGSALTAPFDTIKTRMQLEPDKFSGFIQTLRYIVTKEKIRVLFRGLGLRLTRKALGAGIGWTVYEELIKTL
ncbi:Hem25p Ecym_3351 [Eremothecium cymbalariae DBVPG|uniref:Mitochondrial glycine transporter n=1 Tax=Eremothecium cymbalariae (strain CBS 270.75 / DBVPG 7215 / KCTC 17166 / NRRL Y-17582) TaxID=931890 RepID=G8JRS0_ERECY|nr:Hypothetical protein Ecym_3351 [Eremothecium cymbalariae DBVPG\